MVKTANYRLLPITDPITNLITNLIIGTTLISSLTFKVNKLGKKLFHDTTNNYSTIQLAGLLHALEYVQLAVLYIVIVAHHYLSSATSWVKYM